ncbi:hypothetical protein V1478_016423, partial [Vespula squamosa]
MLHMRKNHGPVYEVDTNFGKIVIYKLQNSSMEGGLRCKSEEVYSGCCSSLDEYINIRLKSLKLINCHTLWILSLTFVLNICIVTVCIVS